MGSFKVLGGLCCWCSWCAPLKVVYLDPLTSLDEFLYLRNVQVDRSFLVALWYLAWPAETVDSQVNLSVHIYITLLVKSHGQINNISTYIYLTLLGKSHGQINISTYIYITLLVKSNGQINNVSTYIYIILLIKAHGQIKTSQQTSTQHFLLRHMVKSTTSQHTST